MLKSCDEEYICTIHNIATFEPIYTPMKPKTVEKELYCILIRNTSTGKIEINTHSEKDQSSHITKINELDLQDDFVSYTNPKMGNAPVNANILQDLEKILNDDKEVFDEDDRKIGTTPLIKMPINTCDNKAIAEKP